MQVVLLFENWITWSLKVEKWPVVLRTYLNLQVLDRGEKIELLVDKTENLRSQVSESYT